jgi:hypothetical protein
MSVKLEFGAAWVQEGPVKIATSAPVKVQDLERAWYRVSH